MTPYEKAQVRLMNAKSETVTEGLNWYKQSRAAVKEIYGKDWRLFVKCLAATSANASLAANVSLARKAFNQIKETGTVRRESFCLAHYRGLLQVSKGRLPNGRKVKAFARALLGDESQVVVDIWMSRVAGLNRQPRRYEYDMIEDRIREEAEALGRTPAGHQAVLWGIARGAGESFSRHLLQYRLF